MELNFCGDGWGQNGSSVGMDEKLDWDGWGWKSQARGQVGMCVISVSMQVSTGPRYEMPRIWWETTCVGSIP